MDQIEIGKFIASCRKEQGMTQTILAEKLGISDWAVSKWETGKSMPDSGIMLELCELLKINVNELLSGERIMAESYDERAEENLLAMRREVEEKNRQMLNVEYLIGTPAMIVGLVVCFIASFVEMPIWSRIVLNAFAVVMISAVAFIAVGIEQKAGYYECQKCRHRHVPTYRQTILARHRGWARYMKCPECGKYSWQKKFSSKEDDECSDMTEYSHVGAASFIWLIIGTVIWIVVPVAIAFIWKIKKKEPVTSILIDGAAFFADTWKADPERAGVSDSDGDSGSCRQSLLKCESGFAGVCSRSFSGIV